MNLENNEIDYDCFVLNDQRERYYTSNKVLLKIKYIL